MFSSKSRRGYDKVKGDAEDYRLASPTSDFFASPQAPTASPIAALLLWGTLLLSLALSSRIAWRFLYPTSAAEELPKIPQVLPYDPPVAEPGSLRLVNATGIGGGRLSVEYAGQIVPFHILAPSAIGRVKRSAPFQTFEKETEPEKKHILLNYDNHVLAQFPKLGSHMNLCAIAAVRRSEDVTTSALPFSRIQVWNVSHTGPLIPSAISYTHRPPRRNFLGDITFPDRELVTHTEPFACPKNGVLVTELQCQYPDRCIMMLQQQQPTYDYGLYVLQWSG